MLLDLLASVSWQDEANINEKIATMLRSVQVDEPSEGMLMPYAELIEQLCSGDLASIVDAISRANVD
ncbi:hypothetical protein OFN94_37395, partial [Escherichia coli]|nr:hypothetical protein [Escherichia coli]